MYFSYRTFVFGGAISSEFYVNLVQPSERKKNGGKKSNIKNLFKYIKNWIFIRKNGKKHLHWKEIMILSAFIIYTMIKSSINRWICDCCELIWILKCTKSIQIQMDFIIVRAQSFFAHSTHGDNTWFYIEYSENGSSNCIDTIILVEVRGIRKREQQTSSVMTTKWNAQNPSTPMPYIQFHIFLPGFTFFKIRYLYELLNLDYELISNRWLIFNGIEILDVFVFKKWV